MTLIDAFVRNPVKVAVGVLLVALFGVVALLRMPMQLTPEVQTPTITIETRWFGASPQEVEREIIQEQEEQLKGVEGVTKMTSESMDSEGRITLEFAVGTDLSESLIKVNAALQQVPEYPEDADEPVISTSDLSDRPIAWFILTVRTPSEEEIAQFQRQHPDLAEPVEAVRRAHNPGLAELRLRSLAKKHPEVRELIPQDIDVSKWRKFAEDVVEARLERVKGVSNSNVLGGQEVEMQVIVDPQRLAARHLTINDLRSALRGQNEDTSGGDFWEGKRRWVVRTLGQFRSPEQVEETIVSYGDGAPVYVRDVAEVQIGYKKPDGFVRRFGGSSIAINAQRETGANVLDVMEGLRRANRELNERVLSPLGLQLTQVYDETEYIYSAIGLVNQNIYIGGALTVCVLLMFLHLGPRTLVMVPLVVATAVAAAYIAPWFFLISLVLIVTAGFWFARGALVIGLAIPTSIVGTFLMLHLFDRSLNVISLAGLAFAVGMLVDNAVVVLENIYRRYQRGEPPFTAAVRGTAEVWGAVVASTLTTLAVFLPVLFVQEEAGQLFRDIALAISSAVGLSLLVSITMIPTSSARLLRRPTKGRHEGSALAARSGDGDGHSFQSGDGPFAERGRRTPVAGRLIGPAIGSVMALFDAFGRRFVHGIVRLNARLQRSLLLRLVTVFVFVGGACGLMYLLMPKVEYLPTGNRNLVFGLLQPPPGYNLDQLMEIGQMVEDRLRPYWDVDPESPQAAELEYPVIGDFFYVARRRQVFLGLRAVDPLRAGELVPLIRNVTQTIPGTITIVNQSSLFERGLGAGRAIDVEITGPDIRKLVDLGRRVLGQVVGDGQVPGVIPNAQVFPRPSLDLSSPEVHVVPKREHAADMGITATDLGYAVDALVDGAYAGDYFTGGDKIDLTIIGQSQFAERTQDIHTLPIATPTGELVPLSAVADVSLGSGPEQINHRERQRAITIQVTPPPEIALEDAMQRIDQQIVRPLEASGELEGGQYLITLSGTADKLRDTWLALRWNLLLALLITYLLMAALFESWLYPFVIILTVPLGGVGGLAGLWLINQVFGVYQPLDVITMLGFIILIGTVVNNAILIVHQSLNHMRHEGMAEPEAILESVRTRIRPIFMTTTTTVFGLLPLVLFPGAGSELYRGLGSVVLGGLIVSTLFTLILIPTMLSLTMQIKEWLLSLRRRPEPPTTLPELTEAEQPVTVR